MIIGSGIGGATVAAALAPSGRRIVILERGERLADCPEARDDAAIFGRGHFRPEESWVTPEGEAFNPGNYYYVGGNSKLYGAVLLRYRAEDFRPIRHLGGTTPGWPISYDEMEPWYQRAEELYRVRGDARQDPTEPRHSGEYPFPPVPDEPSIADLRARLKRAGVTPSSLPLGLDLEGWLKRAATPWDAFPDTTGAKSDAESVGIAAALKHPNVTLETGALVTRLEAEADGAIVAVEYRQRGEAKRLAPRLVILSAGAVNSAVLLLRSRLANRSDQVGRNFMNHNCSAVLAVNPFRRNTAVYQKTLYVNDFYLTGGKDGTPLGNIQLLGKISGPILAAASGVPAPVARWLAGHAVDLYAMSEDLPDPAQPGHGRGRPDRLRLAAVELGGARGAGGEAEGGAAARRAFRWCCRSRSTGGRRRTSAGRRGWEPIRRRASSTSSAGRTTTRTSSWSTRASCRPRRR